MSNIKLNAFYRFCRVRVVDHMINHQQQQVQITTEPDKRYRPICHICKQPAKGVHSYHERMVRDLDVFNARTVIHYRYRKIRCRSCGVVTEDLGLADPHIRMTRRLVRYILELCKIMTIKEIADHLGLNWKTVKVIHKEALKNRYTNEDIGYPVLLAVDEIAVKKRHRYLTVIINWETGTVLYVGKGRRVETVKDFFTSLTEEQRSAIRAVAMDMWDPYIKAVKDSCPQAAIVFDQFHVVSSFGRVINRVRNDEYKKAAREGKEIIKGSKYILLKNKDNLREEEKPRLKALLKLNEAITTAYILKDSLKKLWHYSYPKSCEKLLQRWCSMAQESGIPALISFAKMLTRHSYGIINHCRYAIHTSRLEGINNKIKVIKRKAFGFHDEEYFSLIIKDAFATSN